jgi:hypothetical protein
MPRRTASGQAEGTSTYARARRARRRETRQHTQARQAAAIEAAHTEALAAPAQPPKRATRTRPAPAGRLATAGPVTIRKADGTTSTQPAYPQSRLRRIVRAETATERNAQ